MSKVKVCIAGASGAGKTCIFYRKYEGVFFDDTPPTIGGAFGNIEMENKQGKPIVLEVWDTAGQEMYHSLTQTFFKEANVAILVYDITKQKSFDELDTFAEMAKNVCDQSVMYVVVGNKKDLESERVISWEDGTAYAEKLGTNLFFETSAKTGENVNMLFDGIAQNPNLTYQETKKMSLEPSKQKNGNCNC